MDYLKAVLGDGYNAFVESLNKYNNENKDRQIKLANLADGGYVDKSKHTSLEAEATGYKTQLEKANSDLKALKAANSGNTELAQQIAELQKANKEAAEKFAAELKAAKEAHLLETSLMAENPKNLKALHALIDTSKLKYGDDKVEGLAEQLAALKASDAYLFGEAVPGGTGAPAGGNPPPDPNAFQFNFAGVRPDPAAQPQK